MRPVGFFGWVDRNPQATAPTTPLDPEMGGGDHRFLGRAGLAEVAIHGWASSAVRCEADGNGAVFLGIFGCLLLHEGRWLRPDSRTLLSRCKGAGAGALGEADGSFHAVLFERDRGCLTLVADRFGSVPLYYSLSSDRILFASHPGWILQSMAGPLRLDPAGALQFLGAGYTLGRSTLLAGLQRLLPGERWELDLQRWTVTAGRTPGVGWKPRKSWSMEGATAALHEAVVEAVGTVEASGAGDVALALTGGWDSRLLLASLPLRPGVKYTGLTWAWDDRVPRSDPTVARELAGLKGVPHRSLRYDLDAWEEHAGEWVESLGLPTDNLGICVAGSDFLAGHGVNPGIILIGDHFLGLSGMPADHAEAFSSVLRVPRDGVHPHLGRVLAPAWRTEARAALEAGVAEVIPDREGISPKEYQDRLFSEVYGPGWLMSPGFYRAPSALALRPLLAAPVGRILGELPESMRVDKVVLRRMIRRFFPAFAAVPPAAANSLVDWRHESRVHPGVSAFLRKWTDPDRACSGVLRGGVDPGVLAGWRETFFGAQTVPMRREPDAFASLVTWRAAMMRTGIGKRLVGAVSPAVRALYRQGSMQRSVGSPHVLAFRLALLARLEAFASSLETRTAGRPGFPIR